MQVLLHEAGAAVALWFLETRGVSGDGTDASAAGPTLSMHVLLSALTAGYPKVLLGLPMPVAAAPSAQGMYPQLLPSETMLRLRSQSLHPPPDLFLSEHLCQALCLLPQSCTSVDELQMVGWNLAKHGGLSAVLGMTVGFLLGSV